MPADQCIALTRASNERNCVCCNNTAQLKNSLAPLIMTYLTIVGMLVLTTLPVLVPAIITSGHVIRRRISASSARRVQGRVVLDAIH